jgi:hypothetical protein
VLTKVHHWTLSSVIPRPVHFLTSPILKSVLILLSHYYQSLPRESYLPLSIQIMCAFLFSSLSGLHSLNFTVLHLVKLLIRNKRYILSFSDTVFSKFRVPIFYIPMFSNKVLSHFFSRGSCDKESTRFRDAYCLMMVTYSLDILTRVKLKLSH